MNRDFNFRPIEHSFSIALLNALRSPGIVVVLAAVALFITSCSNKDTRTYDEGVLFAADESTAVMQNTEIDFDLAETSMAVESDSRKIIKEGSLAFVTKDAGQTRAAIVSAVNENKGYISADNVYAEADGRKEYQLTIRIPAERFDALMDAVTKSADGQIDRKTVNANDVTEEFVDVEARLKTKKELENRYRELLQRAVKVEEILAIEREAGTLRSDIEALEGRLKYLTDRVAYSKLAVTYYETLPHRGFGFGDKLTNALRDGWRLGLWVVIGFVNIWPLTIFAIVVWFIIRTIRRRRKRLNE